jgi:hypothetical protein
MVHKFSLPIKDGQLTKYDFEDDVTKLLSSINPDGHARADAFNVWKVVSQKLTLDPISIYYVWWNIPSKDIDSFIKTYAGEEVAKLPEFPELEYFKGTSKFRL